MAGGEEIDGGGGGARFGWPEREVGKVRVGGGDDGGAGAVREPSGEGKEEDSHGKRKRKRKKEERKRKERRREKKEREEGGKEKGKGGGPFSQKPEKGERVATRGRGWERNFPGETLGFGG